MFKLTQNSLTKQLIFFLRYTKSFIKSRYSRGRQWSKTIVYFGLWFNIGSVLGSFFFCYQFSLRTSTFWYFLYAFFNLFICRLYIHTVSNAISISTWIAYFTFILSQYNHQDVTLKFFNNNSWEL